MVQLTINYAKRQALQHEGPSYGERRAGRSQKVASPSMVSIKHRGPPTKGTPVVMVSARTKDIAAHIVHPTGATLSVETPMPWPADRFTFRRLRDGDIVKSES